MIYGVDLSEYLDRYQVFTSYMKIKSECLKAKASLAYIVPDLYTCKLYLDYSNLSPKYKIVHDRAYLDFYEPTHTLEIVQKSVNAHFDMPDYYSHNTNYFEFNRFFKNEITISKINNDAKIVLAFSHSIDRLLQLKLCL